MSDLLTAIHSPSDLKSLSLEQLKQVAAELRQAIIDNLSKTGGHFASNLGAVDMILALHAVYSVPEDKIVWDVGHQCYAHKMLTGRLGEFPTLRQYGGISGFLRRTESPYDLYGAGHASTSISAAYGFAVARDMVGGKESVVAVIGDAGLTGGLALEGLNNAGHSGRDFTVVLNDNAMSIAPNVGALSKYLAMVRISGWYQDIERRTRSVLKRLPAGDMASRAAGGLLKHSVTNLVSPDQSGVVFEQMGFSYIGPLDGHDLATLIEVFGRVKQMQGPVLVHLMTVKGKGYVRAEDDARKFHAVTPFEPATGVAHKRASARSYTAVFADTLIEMAERDRGIVGITAAMPDGTGLDKFNERFPERYFDVGIAEQHAVCFAAGLAAAGRKPVVAIYSTFLQRAFDIIVHDVALQNLPVIFAIDRGGLVGEDGGTHHGVFDLSYLRCIPNMVILSPKDGPELAEMLEFCREHVAGPAASPIAVRYPRGAAIEPDWRRPSPPVELGRAEVLAEGDDVALVVIGSAVQPAFEAARRLADEGIHATVLNARFVKPLDGAAIVGAARRTRRMVLIEENVRAGGFGSGVLEALAEAGLTGVAVRHLGVADHFIEHGAPDILRQVCGLAVDDCVAAARDLVVAAVPVASADRA
ncbi:MAG: 1-deoxy-D-xylulose-5-phosphate synthase [Chthonomonadales bacterium]|nr:1-deoxy-D-xylulose-5-phosphate synthase [Chthonomonadales bacterium]